MCRRFLPLLLAALLLGGCGQRTAEPAFAPENLENTLGNGIVEEDPLPEPPPEPDPDPRETAVLALLERMTLEEKIGQLFFIRCPQLEALEKIGAFQPGGVLLFTNDFKDAAGAWLTEEALVEKISGFQAASPIPLLVGVDEEGGSVARASRNPNLFPEKFAAPQEIFARGGMEAVESDALGKSVGLLERGINVNFAPVADVSTDPGDFIYGRTFGQDGAATAEYVEAVVEIMGVAGIGSVLKHFPGYGGNADTHIGAARDERPYEQFVQEDFLPFQAGVEAGAGGVLVSHNIVACMDGDFPASLSPEVHRILREELGFQGVILTDDLEMDAVEQFNGEAPAAVLALLAGNDMLVTGDFENQIPLAADAVRTGLIPEELLDEAVGRVLGWKYDLGLIGG